jgi:hypothetical protein
MAAATYFAWLQPGVTTIDLEDALAAKPGAVDPAVLDLARALGALHGRRGTPAAFRAFMVAQKALFAFADPADERAAELIDRMYAAAFGGERSDRVLWYELRDIVDGFGLLSPRDEESLPRFVDRILDSIEHHVRPATLDRRRAGEVVGEALLTPRLKPSGVVARILVGLRLDEEHRNVTVLTKTVSQAFAARDRKAGRGARPKA